jgi:hypothetical protein
MSTDTMRSTTARARVLMLLSLLALATSIWLAGPSSSAAAATAVAPPYQHASASFQHTQVGSYEGGYISCPAGTKAVATGASAGANGYLMAGLTTHDGNGGYHIAWGWNGNPLQLSARCVTPDRLTGDTLTTRVLRSDRYMKGREISCPTGTVPYGGGAFTTYQGQAAQGLMTIASMPSVHSWSGTPVWKYVGVGGASELHLSAHCLPRERLGRLVTVTESTPAPVPYRPVSVSARCPQGYFAFTGGASVTADNGDSSPAYRGYLTTSTMAADDRGWTAAGYSFQAGTRVYATVTCTDRLG